MFFCIPVKKGPGRPNLGKTATIKKRVVMVYLPTEELVKQWKDYAARHDVSVSQFVYELVDNTIRKADAQLIATVPGIGFYGALLIHAEIDDIKRFSHPEKLCAYAGLVPTVRQSASSVHYGAISKVGSSYLRWMLTEAVHTHVHCEPSSRLSRFNAKVARRRGKHKATIATARKLLLVIYWMLVRHEPYHSQGLDPGFPPARNECDIGIGADS